MSNSSLQYPAPIQAGPRRRNTLGLVAMILAIIGFIFACVPGALIIGWILLPVSFILGLVALFRKGETQWQAVTAVVLAVVGTIVGVIVFIAFLGEAVDKAVDEAFSPTASAAAPSGSAGVGSGSAASDAAGTSRDNPLPLGMEISSKDWKIVVNSVTLHANDQVAAANRFNQPPAEGNEYILVNYTVTYTGDDPSGSTPFESVEYVTPGGVSIGTSSTFAVASDEIDTLTTLYNGGSVTGSTVLEVPSDGVENGVLSVRPGLLVDKKFVSVK
ncbi:hypothetical protein ABXS69_03680 [Actinomyces timonensis]|uniref:DUF4352 domain-containing protein n=1 Tax=Actinomyces timonensis TaxID=1288391 RepID=A0AAU8N3A6_9ACTO